MIRTSTGGSIPPEASSHTAAGLVDETSNQELASALPVSCTEQELCLATAIKAQPQPIKRLMINRAASDTAPAPSIRPSGLPLQFIDQQKLRQSSGSDLRRVVRSHARRDVDVKRRHIKATLQARSPRPLLEKKSRKEQLLSKSSHNHAADNTSSASQLNEQDSLALPIQLHSTPSNAALSLNHESAESSSIAQRYLHHIQGHGRVDGAPESIPGIEIMSVAVDRAQDFRWQGDEIHGDYQAPGSFDSLLSPRNSSSILLPQTGIPSPYIPNNADVRSNLVAGTWRHDPFNVHGELNNPRVSFLLSHYNNILATVWVYGDKLLSFQTSRPELLHTIILFTASHLQALTNSNEYDRDIFHHRGEAIRIINSSLDDPSEQTSDQMIAALSSLILYEVSTAHLSSCDCANNREDSYGSKETASMHRQGLQQILKLRYAKPDLGIHRFVQHILAHPLAVAGAPEEPTLEDSPITASISIQSTSKEPRNTPLGHAVTTSFQWLTSSAAQFESASYINSDTYQVRQDIEEFLELCPNYPREKLSFGFRSWLLAAMVYLHVAIVPPSAIHTLPRNVEEILAQLKSAMYGSTTESQTISACSPRLWVLMLNGLYARTTDPVLLGSPPKMDLSTVSALHWCRAQLLLRDIPWAERRWKLEPIEDDWEWVQANGFWRESVSKWNSQ
ncbi:uncharacterized protein LY89DRAFT_722740 [Mollisia scopiformis]|uniref:Uncharacterized protein n=1 Tax=Mollisia scopiformis TaxID=149040 RepID=A0A194WUI6_MOLSC|nr:uncharacterized protein LY89DRAFT_722740 [Mollisia scopiformis]KUJ11628.1 hypothetical protein LY89DRAFT_722740 [Mollisia scopiformis]